MCIFIPIVPRTFSATEFTGMGGHLKQQQMCTKKGSCVLVSASMRARSNLKVCSNVTEISGNNYGAAVLAGE